MLAESSPNTAFNGCFLSTSMWDWEIVTCLKITHYRGRLIGCDWSRFIDLSLMAEHHWCAQIHISLQISLAMSYSPDHLEAICTVHKWCVITSTIWRHLNSSPGIRDQGQATPLNPVSTSVLCNRCSRFMGFGPCDRSEQACVHVPCVQMSLLQLVLKLRGRRALFWGFFFFFHNLWKWREA